MKQHELLNRINELLAIFVTEIKLSTKANMYDRNIISEDVLVPIFKEVFNYQDLRNLNKDKTNYPGIDLADDTNKVTFQITATANSEKVKKTLRDFVKYEHYKKYERLIIYVLTEKQKRYSGSGFEEIIQHKYAFNKDTDIIDSTNLFKRIKSLSLEKIQKVKLVLEDHFSGDKFENLHVQIQDALILINRGSEIAIREPTSAKKLSLSESRKKFKVDQQKPQFKNILEKFLSPDQDIKYEPYFQRAPEIPDDFIKRDRKIEQINSLLDAKSYLFIFGITRSTKTFLISQYIQQRKIASYYWFDFKENASKDDQLFYGDIARFVSTCDSNPIIQEQWNSGHLSISELAYRTGEVLNNHKIHFLILDNVHGIDKAAQVFSFLESCSQCSTNIKFILISEDRDTFRKVTQFTFLANPFELNGFDSEEIKQLFEKNKCDVSNFTPQLLFMIESTTQGHPDLINGLLEQVKKQQDSTTQLTVLLTNAMSGWKILPEKKIISDALAEKIYEVQLQDDDERRLFNRLCNLSFNFSEPLAKHIANIPPIIKDFGLKFRRIRLKLLDMTSHGKFSVPNLIQDVGRQMTTKKEKESIYIFASNFLLTPKNNSIDFENAVEACFYLLYANQIAFALHNVANILANMLEKGIGIKKLEYVLDRLDLFLALKVPEAPADEMARVYMLFAHAYRIVNNESGLDETLNKLVEIEDKIIDPVNKVIVKTSLIYQFCNQIENVDKTIQRTIELAQFYKLDPKSFNIIGERILTDFLSLPFSQVFLMELPNISFLIKLTKEYLTANLKLVSIFRIEQIDELFEGLYAKLYNLERNGILKKEQLTSEIIKELEELFTLFRQGKHFLAARDVSYIIGCILLDFGKNPKESLYYFDRAIQLHLSKSHGNDTYLANIFIGRGDAFYNSKKYTNALNCYKKAIKIYSVNKKVDLLSLHACRRAAICLFYKKKFKESETYFWKAISTARGLDVRRELNLLETFGDFSTFFIKTKKYNLAVKCFSIMVSMLKLKKLEVYRQAIGHSVGWLRSTLSGNWHGRLSNPDGTSSERDWTPPYFGMYTGVIEYRHENLSEIGTNFILAETMEAVGLTEKAKRLYHIILNSKLTGKLDLAAVIQSADSLHRIYWNNSQFEEAIDCILESLKVVGTSPTEFLIHPYNEDDFFLVILYKFLIPYVNSSIQRFDTIEQFRKKENQMLYFVARSVTMPAIYKYKLQAFSMSATSWMYFYNDHLDDSFLNNGKEWNHKGQKIAREINFYYVLIHNRIFLYFSLPRRISSFRVFTEEIFETLSLIIKDWKYSSNYIEVFYDRVSNVWTSFDPEKIKPRFDEVRIVRHLKDLFEKTDSESLNPVDKAITLSYSLIQISDLCSFDEEDVCKVIEFCLQEISSTFQNFFLIFLESYQKYIKVVINRSISHPDDIIEIAEHGKKILSKFVQKNQQFFDDVTKEKTDELLIELKALSGNLGLHER